VSIGKIFQIFFVGMLISFVGSLPLGTLNIAAMQLAIQEGTIQGILFSIGSLAVEMVYVWVSLQSLAWMTKQARLMKWLEYICLVIVLALAVYSFYNAAQIKEGAKPVALIPWMNRFLLGLFMSAINPVQIPFWFGWSTILFEKKILNQNKLQYLWYILGIGLGTFAGNCLFIFGGKYVAAQINNNQSGLNVVIGCIFTGTALLQIIKMIRKNKKATKPE
jgi:threonine/homoserine/homoserine lactone efflux protein